MAYEWRGSAALASPAATAFLTRKQGSQQAAPINWGDVASNAIRAEGERRVAEEQGRTNREVAKTNAEALVKQQTIKTEGDIKEAELAAQGTLDSERIRASTAFGTNAMSAALKTNEMVGQVYADFRASNLNQDILKFRQNEADRTYNLRRMGSIVTALGSFPSQGSTPPPLAPPVPRPDFGDDSPIQPASGSPFAGASKAFMGTTPGTANFDSTVQSSLPTATLIKGSTVGGESPQFQAPAPTTIETPKVSTPSTSSGGGASSPAGKPASPPQGQRSKSPGSVESFGMADLSGNTRGWLAALRKGEGTSGEKGYATRFGGGTFDPSKPHPDTVVHANGYSSAASGAYQFMPATWMGANGGQNVPMTPEAQDRAAIYLAKQRGVDLATAPFTRENVAKLSPEWASLPALSGKSAYDQPVKKFEELQAVFQAQQG